MRMAGAGAAIPCSVAAVQGRAMLKALEHQKDWDIIAVSRSPVPNLKSRAHFISLDLTNKKVGTACLTGIT